MWHCSVAKRVCAWRSSLTRHSGRLIPTARIVDSNVNRRGSTRCDSPSALDGGDGDDRSNHTFGLVDGRSAGGGGTHAGREGGSSDAGDRAVAGRLVAGSCGGGLCDERQTLRDWVHRYNEAGLDGLYDRRRRNGPPPRLSAEQQAKVAAWVEQGPDLERDGVVRWRCIDLQRRITQEFAVTLHERTVGKLLRKLSFRRLSVRPQHPQSKPEEQAVFRATSPIS